jgi:phytoene desaturase
MYLGLSPYDAPWVYGTLAYMEYGEGIWYPKGGLPVISEAIAKLAEARGAEIRLNANVTSITGGVVTLADGEVIAGDLVITNADMPYAQRALSKSPPKRKLRYSCSAHLLYLDYEGELADLNHHSVFFGKDFKGNLDALFHDLAIPNDPAFYACLSKRSDPSVAPAGHENLFLLIPVPNLDCVADSETLARLEDQVFDRLEREVGFDRTKIRAMKRRTREDWNREFNLEKGAAFGISHDLFQSAFMRPQNRCKTNANLYFVGASTVPGNGLPMVLISAELVEKRLIQEGAIPA